MLDGKPMMKPNKDMQERDLPAAGGSSRNLLRIVAGERDEAIAAYQRWRASIDFSGPIDDQTTQLLPQLQEALLRLGIEDPLAGVFKGIGRRAWYENQTLLANAQPAFEALALENISFTLVGEAPLMLAAYGRAYLRRIGQIDIVVSPERAQEAARAINGTKWQAAPLTGEEIAFRYRRPFSGPAARTLTLHWHFIGAAPTPEVDAYFRTRCLPYEMQGTGAMRLTPEAALLHFLLSDIPPLGNQPALWIADVLALIRKPGRVPDWQAIVDFAIDEKLASRLRHRLELIAGFPLGLPDEALHRLSSAPASLPERIERFLLRRHPTASRWSVFADYLRSRRPAGPVRGLAAFPRFLRHRWELAGRREIPAALGRYLMRRLRPRPSRVSPAE
jgi:hypothetical protein